MTAPAMADMPGDQGVTGVTPSGSALSPSVEPRCVSPAAAASIANAHTPGPWAVSKNSSGRRVTSATGIVICNAVLRNTGRADRGIRHGAKEHKEAEANAHLIAASPDMLTGLDWYADQLCEGWCEQSPDWAKFEDCAGCMARRIAAKARGEVA